MISHVGQRSPVTAALGASDVGLHGEHKVLDCSGLPLKSGEEATDFEDVSQSDAVRGFVVELASHAPWDGDIKKEKKRFDALRHKISKSYRVISNLDRSVAQRTMNDDRQVFPPISAILRTYNSLVSQGVVKHDPALKSLFIRKEVTPRPLKSRRTFLAAAPRHTKTESSARPNDRRVAPRAPPPRQHRRPPGPRIHAAPCASVPTSLHPRPPPRPLPPRSRTGRGGPAANLRPPFPSSPPARLGRARGARRRCGPGRGCWWSRCSRRRGPSRAPATATTAPTSATPTAHSCSPAGAPPRRLPGRGAALAAAVGPPVPPPPRPNMHARAHTHAHFQPPRRVGVWSPAARQAGRGPCVRARADTCAPPLQAAAATATAGAILCVCACAHIVHVRMQLREESEIV